MTNLNYDAPVIEDAQSLGSFIIINMRTFGLFGVLSFHNTKFIHAGFGEQY